MFVCGLIVCYKGQGGDGANRADRANRAERANRADRANRANRAERVNGAYGLGAIGERCCLISNLRIGGINHSNSLPCTIDWLTVQWQQRSVKVAHRK